VDTVVLWDEQKAKQCCWPFCFGPWIEDRQVWKPIIYYQGFIIVNLVGQEYLSVLCPVIDAVF
jgi:hypothetical protein